ncbi:unnamed protein product, partial [Ectocarpus fasciculatus]
MLSSRGRRHCRGGPRRWTLLTPTVLWSVVILAMTPSFYGFAGGLGGLPTGRSTAGTRGVAAADLASAGSSGATGSAKGSPFAAASWLKERVRDGKRRVQMQVMSMVPDTSMDAKCFDDAPVPVDERGFYINGWRWHSRAVLRDIARFRRAALLAAEASGGADGGGEKGAAAVERVAKCYGFMWTF